MIGSYVNAGYLPSHREDRDEVVDATPIRRRGLSSRIAEFLGRLDPRSTSPHLLLMNGFDHQFPQADLPRIIAMINADNPRLEAVHSSLPRYIEAVRARRVTTVTRYNAFSGLPAWIRVDRWEVDLLASRVPGHGYAAFVLEPSVAAPCFLAGLFTASDTMDNGHCVVRVLPNGTLELTDKATGAVYRGLMGFDDCGDAGNGLEQVSPLADRVITSLGGRAEISVVQDSALTASLRVRLVMEIPEGLTPDGSGRSERTVPCIVTSTVSLRRGSRAVEIRTTVENSARDHRLRVLFSSGIESDTVWAEEPFDVIERAVRLPDPCAPLPAGVQTDLSDELPSRIQPKLSFVDICDGSRGLMVANRGIYAYEALEDEARTIALTLLRCTSKLYRYGFGDSEDLDIPEAQCLGTYAFDYALIPHAGTWENGWRAAYEFTRPMRVVLRRTPEDAALAPLPASPGSTPSRSAPSRPVRLPARHSFVQLEGDSLLVTAVKGSESGGSVILRVSNPFPRPAQARIRLAVPGRRAAAAYHVRLDETHRSPCTFDTDGWIPVSVKALGVGTLEVVMD
jgi:mannosylglycerate hydrolase